MKREEKSLKFYNDFSEKAGVEEHKKLFQILAQEEAKHKLKQFQVLTLMFQQELFISEQ